MKLKSVDTLDCDGARCHPIYEFCARLHQYSEPLFCASKSLMDKDLRYVSHNLTLPFQLPNITVNSFPQFNCTTPNVTVAAPEFTPNVTVVVPETEKDYTTPVLLLIIALILILQLTFFLIIFFQRVRVLGPTDPAIPAAVEPVPPRPIIRNVIPKQAVVEMQTFSEAGPAQV